MEFRGVLCRGGRHRPRQSGDAVRRAEILSALVRFPGTFGGGADAALFRRGGANLVVEHRAGEGLDAVPVHARNFRTDDGLEIGRASCRERVCQYVYISVVAVSLKKKKFI